MNACVDRIIQEIEWNKRDGISSVYTKNEDGNGLDEDSADSAETQDTTVKPSANQTKTSSKGNQRFVLPKTAPKKFQANIDDEDL